MMLLQQFLLALSFFTRIPLPKTWNAGDATLAQSAWAFPLTGAIIGGFAAATYLALLSLGLNHSIAAWISLGFLVIFTGG